MQPLFAINREHTFAALSLIYIFLSIIAYFTLVITDYSYSTVWLNDIFGLIDAANRVNQGELPYKDFHFFYGPLVAWIPGLGLHLGINVHSIFAFNGLVVSALLFLCGIIILPKRLPVFPSSIVFLFTWLLISIPLGDGRNFYEVSWGTFYNRQSWAAILLVLSTYIEPEHTHRGDVVLDTISVTILALLLIGSKFTFGLIAVVFISLNAFVSRYNRNISLASIFLTIFILATIELYSGLVSSYVEDIWSIGQWFNTQSIFSRWKIVNLFLDNADIAVASSACLITIYAYGGHSIFDWLFVAGSFIAIAFLRATVGAGAGLFPFFIVFLCIGELARRRLNNKTTDHPNQPAIVLLAYIGPLFCMILACAFITKETGNRLLAWIEYSRKTANHSSSTNATEIFHGFSVPQSDKVSGGSIGITTYLKSVAEGTQLLRQTNKHNYSVLTFDMINPFPYFANMKPPPHGYPLFWLNGPAININPDVLPSSQQFVGQVDVIMVPILPYSNDQLKNMMYLYGDYLEKNYSIDSKSKYWIIYTHRLQ